MEVLNLRLCFATNSSSTHSVVLLPPDHLLRGESAYNEEYGWDNFVLRDQKDKQLYFAHQLRYNLKMPEWMKHIIIKKLTGVSYDENGYIDHQSILYVPANWDGEGIDEEFVKELMAFVKRDNVAIVGGNDNEEGESHKDALSVLKTYYPEHTTVCRKEDSIWVLFNRETGHKVTLSFDGVIERPRPEAPELLDVKVTDFCLYGCPMCYQASTPDGKHADMSGVRQLAEWCGNNRVFEVAIGGGEPTMHPDFINILRAFRDKNVVPNFTTHNMNWLRDEEMRPRILKHIGAFALSVDSNNYQDAIRHVEKYADGKANFHVVLGTMNQWGFKSIMRAAHKHDIQVTILGWKPIGRGTSYVPEPYAWWLDAVMELNKEHECPAFGIDTVVAQEFDKEMKAIGIPSYLYHTEEGKYSYYFDMVNFKYGKSSFDIMHEIPHSVKYRDNKEFNFGKAWKNPEG